MGTYTDTLTDDFNNGVVGETINNTNSIFDESPAVFAPDGYTGLCATGDGLGNFLSEPPLPRLTLSTTTYEVNWTPFTYWEALYSDFFTWEAFQELLISAFGSIDVGINALTGGSPAIGVAGSSAPESFLVNVELRSGSGWKVRGLSDELGVTPSRVSFWDAPVQFMWLTVYDYTGDYTPGFSNPISVYPGLWICVIVDDVATGYRIGDLGEWVTFNYITGGGWETEASSGTNSGSGLGVYPPKIPLNGDSLIAVDDVTFVRSGEYQTYVVKSGEVPPPVVNPHNNIGPSLGVQTRDLGYSAYDRFIG